MSANEFVELAGQGLDVAGVLMIVGGLLLATMWWGRAPRGDGRTRYQRFRQDLGRAILLGLEVLVAADIVRSVALTPTPESLTVLAMIVAIRTFLSWSLSLELEGHWPWQRTGRPVEPPA